MKKAAVITGDIVHSREINKRYRNEVIRTLKKVYTLLNHKFFNDQGNTNLEFFRGDSFQALVGRPEYSLRISLLIRAKIRSLTAGNKSEKRTSSPVSSIWDARIAIGVGETDFRSRRIVESDGTAFVLSGKTLDKMKNKDERICAETLDHNFNDEFRVQLLLADTIVKRWTIAQSEAAYLYLSEPDKTQTELAESAGISQSALSRRIRSGNIDCIQLLCQRFETLISKMQ